MELIKHPILSALNQDCLTAPTRSVPVPVSSSSNSCSVRSINALDCIGRPIEPEHLLKAEELLKANYGIDYPEEKLTLLWMLIQEEGWTDERLMRTVKWVLKTKKYPNWTIADFFEYEVKLHPWSWYAEQIHKGVKHEEMKAYRVNGKVYWTMDDGIALPLEKA